MKASAACLEHGRSHRLAVKAAAQAAAAARQLANTASIQAEEDAARQTAIEAQLLQHRYPANLSKVEDIIQLAPCMPVLATGSVAYLPLKLSSSGLERQLLAEGN